VLDIRFLFAYDIDIPDDEKQRGALLIAASLIAAIRLRGEPIKPSPKLSATIYDSVQLAVLVWRGGCSRARRCRRIDESTGQTPMPYTAAFG
jgi:hypothetical protein